MVPINSCKYAIYSCGPTIYTHLHIGNYRSIIYLDTYASINKIDYYLGLTDISDKIENLLCEDYAKFRAYVTQFYNTLSLLHVCCTICSVSSHIKSIVEILNLLKTKNKIIECKQEVRLVEGNTSHYALWKKAKKINFVTPYGCGHPGWHVECVAHVHRLYKTYDCIIHGGGIDLKNTHHKYEIMLFDILNIPIKWLHVQNVTNHYVKISKSKGHTLYINQFEPYFARYLLLSEDYDTCIELNESTIIQKRKQYQKLITNIYSTMYLGLTQKECIILDPLRTGATLRFMYKNFNLDKFKELNIHYKIVDPLHYKYNKKLDEMFNLYNLNKLAKQYNLCDKIKQEIYSKFKILYNGKTLIYVC